MESRKEIATAKKAAGTHNCAQAVATTYADYMNMNEEDVSNITSAFGTGMGNMEGTCGAIVGAGVVIGAMEKDRVKSRQCMRELITKFQQRNGATQCKLLKGVGTGTMLRHCNDCVADAAEFLEAYIAGNSNK